MDKKIVVYIQIKNVAPNLYVYTLFTLKMLVKDGYKTKLYSIDLENTKS